MSLGPYVMSKVLNKGTYELIDFEGNKLPEPRNGLYLKKYYAQDQRFSLYFIVCIFMYNSSLICVIYTIYWLLQMSSKWFIGFSYGVSPHTCNLASAAWDIYSPSVQLVSSGGACLGLATNNMVEYRAFIDILWDSLSHGITQLEVRLDSQMVVSHLNRAYQV